MFEPLPLVVEAPGDTASIMSAAAQAADRWRLPAPELIRVGANGVFVCGDVILRVGRATAPMGAAITLAQRMTAAGVRVAQPARPDWLDLDGGLSVTAWQRIDIHPDAPVDWERVGAMVRVVHSIDPLTIDHPLPFCADFPWWNVTEMLAEADVLDAPTRDALQADIQRHQWWIDVARQQPPTLCHGDVHPGNVVVDGDGPVLLDWDLLCIGPPEWDHAALWTWTARWGGEPGIYERFATGYGADVDAEMAAAIAQMRLVIAMLMRLRRARFDPGQRDEVERRLALWRGDPNPPMWRAQ